MTTQIKRVQLKNGLTIIGEECSWYRSVSTGIFVKTGARDETEKESGISHFLEHMVFKGTNRRSSSDITFEMGNIGAQANAYTSEENTVFYGTVLPEYFPHMVDIVCDMMQPLLDQAEFDMEKKVILEEIALYEDNPKFCMFVNAFMDYFHGHPSGKSVLGTLESVGAITRDEMAAYHRRRYSPSNMALVAAGKFSFDELVALGEKYLGDLPNFPAQREMAAHSYPQRAKQFKKKNLNQAYLLLASPGPNANQEERIPLAILSAILGDGSGSKMYWELVHTGIAEYAVAEMDERDDSGVVVGFASCEVKNLAEVQGKIEQILSRPLDFSDDELERVKKKLLSRVVLGGETPSSRLFALGHGWTARNTPEPLGDVVEQIRGVTRSSIEDALKKFPLKSWSVYSMIPEASSM